MTIKHPDDGELGALRDQLSDLAPTLDCADPWPEEQLRLCGEAGVYQWFIPRSMGGVEWSSEWLMRGYMALGQGCTTTTFLITQRAAAIRRIVASQNIGLMEEALPAMVGAAEFVTIGISHLTTSQRHLGAPVVLATAEGDGWRVSGRCPWVSGADRATSVVVGAVTNDGRVLEMFVPCTSPGVSAGTVFDLTALQASRTGDLRLDQVRVESHQILSGPKVPEPILGTGTGGLHTSALAVGLAQRAIAFIETEVERRPELGRPLAALQDTQNGVANDLLAAARGEGGDPITLRINANLLVNQACNGALITAKGAGFVSGHPMGRANREALFFWVWSCPATVSAGCLEHVSGSPSSG